LARRDGDSSDRLEQFLGRVVPHSIEAEESLLGAMLMSREAVSEAIEIIKEDDFFRPSHGHIFYALAKLHAEGAPNDAVTVSEELKRHGLLEAVGGLEALIALQASTPAIGSAGRYSQIVEEYSLLRKLIRAASEIAEMAYGLPDDISAAVDLAEAKIFEVAEHRTADTMRPLRDSLLETLDTLEAFYESSDAVTGISTGYIDLDEKLSGLQPSSLVIVGARPGMGKTSFALGMGVNAAKVTTEPVLMFSLEMSHQELTQRLVAAEARVDSTRLRSGNLQEKDWEKIHLAIGRLADAKIYIDDDPNLTVLDIRARARRLKAREGLGLVIVDYLQLMSGRRNVESRQVEVSEISRGLKILARELSVPVVALSQLSRNLESRADKRPQLADLRESGCVTWDTEVRLASGESVPIGLAWMRSSSGGSVLSVGEGGVVQAEAVSAIYMTGVRPVFEVTTNTGRTVRATANHPFYRNGVWTRLDQLKVGDSLSVGVECPQGQGLPRAGVLARAGGSSLPSSGGCSSVGIVDDSPQLSLVTESVRSIRSTGEEPVFDITVDSTHCFFGNGFLLHNSLEQDADVVIFIYRDEMYDPETQDRGTAEVIIAKHRSGPVGTVYLAFLNNYTLFANMAPST
jgi:replicative DNA helicase